MAYDKWEVRTLVNKLNEYTEAYDKGTPIISDKEWDDLYFKLVEAEKETGIVFQDSPTNKIYFKTVSELSKVEHKFQPMLSLDKTKDPKEIERFLFKDPKYWDWFAMFKMDGLSCRLTYINGELAKGETRGNGIIGEDITHNVKVIKNIPKRIPTKEETIIIDGEVICTFDDFKEFENDYKNPRNFASGSIRLLDAKESASRKLAFVAWDLVVGCEDIDFIFHRLEKLDDWGFTTVPRVGDAETVQDAIDTLDRILELDHSEYPIDGYVFKFESKSYGESLGRTEHHFKNAIAFKFYDDEYETELIDIEWSMGRTGQLTPVAIFKPIDIDSTIIERASLHNFSIMRETLGDYPDQDQKIWVIKSNQIIPQITRAIKNDIPHDHTLSCFPNLCPYCGEPTELRESESGVLNYYCTNSSCIGKLSNRIDHFCGKKGLDIKGISLTTIEKLINWGWLNGLTDIFRLEQHKTEWISKEGFGTASVGKILLSIDATRSGSTLEAFISAIGIPLVGRAVAREIVKYYDTWEDFKNAVSGDWTQFDGFGPEISKAINSFDYSEADEIAGLLTFKQPLVQNESSQDSATAVRGKTFCVTGSLTHFSNRTELKNDIESLGGRVVGSMSSKVDFLINNDINSTSSKNQAAKKAGVPIITEEDYLRMKD